MTGTDEQDFNGMPEQSLSALRALLTLLDFAKEQFTKRGAFLPFGAVIDESTGLSLVMRDDDTESNGEKHVNQLAEVLHHRAAAGGVLAAALCFYCVVVPPGAEAENNPVCFHFEDARKQRWNLFFPFVGGAGEEVVYQPWHYERGEQWIFKGS